MLNSRIVVTLAFCAIAVPSLADNRTRTPTLGGVEERSRSSKITICHHAKSDGFWATISVSTKSFGNHERHGDCVIDDGIACTIDSCDAAVGCIHRTDDSVCDDGVFCNGIDVCDSVDGCVSVSACPPTVDGCVTRNAVCDEANDVCHDIVDDAACDNGNGCDGDERCDALTGDCTPGTPLDCDDGVDCTVDICDSEVGCIHQFDDCLCPEGMIDENGQCFPVSDCVQATSCNSGPEFCCEPVECLTIGDAIATGQCPQDSEGNTLPSCFNCCYENCTCPDGMIYERGQCFPVSDCVQATSCNSGPDFCCEPVECLTIGDAIATGQCPKDTAGNTLPNCFNCCYANCGDE